MAIIEDRHQGGVIPPCNWQQNQGVGRFPTMAVISLKLPETLDAQLTEQAQRRRLSTSESPEQLASTPGLAM